VVGKEGRLDVPYHTLAKFVRLSEAKEEGVDVCSITPLPPFAVEGGWGARLRTTRGTTALWARKHEEEKLNQIQNHVVGGGSTSVSGLTREPKASASAADTFAWSQPTG